jgi:hypothetical protein
MKSRLFLLSAVCLIVTAAVRSDIWRAGQDVSGELKQWHTVTLTFTGPQASEIKSRTHSWITG